MLYYSSTVSSFPKSERKPLYNSSQTPGPGRYVVKASTSNKSLGKFDKEKKMIFKPKDTPGVGSYDYNMKPTSPQFSMSKNKIAHSNTIDSNLVSIDITPGPGRYNIEKSQIRQNAVSVRGKPKELKKDPVPGPGSYSTLTNFQHNKGISFSKTAKDYNPCGTMSPLNNSKINFYNNQTPGPGRYAVKTEHKKATPSYTFSRDNKEGYQFKKEKPGPGEYETIKGTINTAFSFPKSTKRQLFDNKSMSNVGPGRYGNLNNTTVGKGFKIGTSPRRFHTDNHLPGPGEYEPKLAITKTSGTCFSISKAKRDDVISNSSKIYSPGPGRYLTSTNKIGKGFIFGKEELKGIPITLGPGQYDAKSDFSKPNKTCYSISKSKRDDIHHTIDTPGPGRYGSIINMKNTSSISTFSKDPKNKPLKSETPGPGSYEFLNSIRDFSGVMNHK